LCALRYLGSIDQRNMAILGIDIGGSGIKGAPVDTKTGEMLGDRFRIPTPEDATPAQVIEIIREIAAHHNYEGAIGCTFPGVIQGQTILTAANLPDRFIGVCLSDLIREATGQPAWMINDGDAAGLAEVRFGAGRDCKGTIIMITVGTGLGSAMFTNGQLVANTEIGHLLMRDKDNNRWGDVEKFTSDAARQEEGLKWSEWGKRFNRYLKYLDSLFWPELFIIGGGAAKKFSKYADALKVQTTVIPAQLENRAGIIGAATCAAEHFSTVDPNITPAAK